MSITDELREWASIEVPYKYGNQLTAIADRIDAEHEKATSEFWQKINAVPATDENMAEHGWIRLPVDADGEPVHIGDVMAYADNTKPKEVIALVPPAVFLTEDGPRYADMCRHHHAPTVEDVLAEFFEQVGDGLHTLEAMDTQLIIAKYAAKFRLADDGKEQQ